MKISHRITSTLVLLALMLVSALAIPATPANAAEAKRAVVNINSADASQLALLPRVGPSVAQRIIEYRKQNGPFKSPEDLMLVRGIGEKTYQLIKPHIALSGETTLREKVKSSRPGSAKEGSR